MLLDLAHASANTIDDALAMRDGRSWSPTPGSRAPATTRATSPTPQLRGVAPREACRHRLLGDRGLRAGAGRLARASAMRGWPDRARRPGVRLRRRGDVAFDAAGLVDLTEALLAAGFDDAEVAKVMGGNAVRLLSAALP